MKHFKRMTGTAAVVAAPGAVLYSDDTACAFVHTIEADATEELVTVTIKSDKTVEIEKYVEPEENLSEE